ncbi:MAG: hypothetical protein NTX56_05550 [Proteobacteria bacterium]|nr:hypothetical protein [Pseudomonadota bacterium]
MNTITLAQTTLIVNNLRTNAFWAELDSAIQKLHGTAVIHASGSRDYRLPSIEMRVNVVGSAITVSWISRSPVLDARGRIDLRQSADAWLDTLAALMLRPAPVAARVQAASALLAAGFDSVSVSTTGAASMLLMPGFEQALAA